MNLKRNVIGWLIYAIFWLMGGNALYSQQPADPMRQLQFNAVDRKLADWGHWGVRASQYSSWTNHSNRLVPVYTWGIGLDAFGGASSAYRSEARLTSIYGSIPENTLNPKADYFDQTEIYRLQKMALDAGKKNVILFVVDGLDYETTQAAAIYKSQTVYDSGRGQGLHFLDYRKDRSHLGAMVTSPHNTKTKVDVNAQVVTQTVESPQGGYSAELGGSYPWSKPASLRYLIGQERGLKHAYTDSAASATSMNSGIKTYNSAINIDPSGKQVRPIAHDFQSVGYSVGVVTSVPISHATPACAYAHNVSRNDYQDLTRDLLGLSSASHRTDPLPGVEVLIGCGWGESKKDDRKRQGENYVPGNKYLPADALEQLAQEKRRYEVVLRTAGKSGNEILQKGALKAKESNIGLFGFFGVKGGHLPYQTANGDYQPTRGASSGERYQKSDIEENPTLAEMVAASLTVLSNNKKGFWLMVESGDVDWANHNNNLDDSIGAVLSADEAFKTLVDWVDENSDWNETALILTADHGHLLVLTDLEALRCSSDNTELRANVKRIAAGVDPNGR